MATDRDVLRDYEEVYMQAETKLREFREEGRKDIQYFLNKQLSDDELNYLHSEGREALVNNKIRRAIMLVSGWQRANRKSSNVIAQGEESNEASDIMSEAVQWLYMKNGGYDNISDCFFYGSLISGMNFSEAYLNYTSNHEVPDINFGRVPYNACVWDPYFSRLDMADCNYFIRRRLIAKNDVLRFLPSYAKEIKDFKIFGGDGKFTEMPAQTEPNGQEILAYTEYWQRDIANRMVIVDANTNELVGLVDKGISQKQAEEVVAFNPMVKLIKRWIPTVNMHIIINDELIETVEDPLGINEYPFTPFFGIYIPEHDEFDIRLQSALRVARDPQSELNKRINKFLDILDSKTHTGWIFKKKALADGEDPYRGGNFRSIAIKHDAVIGQDIAPISPPPTDPSLIQALTIFDQNIMDTLGINDASFGTPEGGNDSGLLTMIRQQSSVVGLNPFFDQLNACQYQHTKKSIKLMQRHWPQWKWERVTGKKFVPQVLDPSFSKFDIQVSQGIITETQEKQVFAQLVQMKQMGINIPDSMIIKYMPLQDKGTFLKEMQAMEQQQAQQQQQQMQLAQQQIALANEKTVSEIEENRADTVRQTGRAYADISLSRAHESEAVQKRANAALDAIKAVQEIQSNEDARFLQNLNFVDQLTSQYKDETEMGMLTSKNIVDENVANLTQGRV